jgi:hypothetical protein
MQPPKYALLKVHVADYVQVVTFAAQSWLAYRETLENSANL